jgi:hypothetical protein
MKQSLILLFLLISLPAEAQLHNTRTRDALIIDHHAVTSFDAIPTEVIKSAIPNRLMFRHASVGVTINNGLDCLQGSRTSPTECKQYVPYMYDRRNWEFQLRANSGWYGKIDDFKTEVLNQADSFDCFSFKYCYLDGLDGLLEPCGSPYSPPKVEKAWNYLRNALDTLEMEYPDKVFIWWTIPLTQVGQVCTDTLNARIRSYASAKGKILFDVADIESHDAADTPRRSPLGLQMACSEFCGEQNPGAQACHPNWTGSIRLARAFWYLMARLTGWNPVTSITGVHDPAIFLENYPNPCTAETTIRFQTSGSNGSTQATLRIFDGLGREAVTLFDAHVPQGTYSIPFDTRGLNNGVYWCRLCTVTGTVSKAILIIH